MTRRQGQIRPTDARRDHTWVDADGVRRERAWVDAKGAKRAADVVESLTGRHYMPYPCRDPRCGGWHIRRSRLPEGMARPA